MNLWSNLCPLECTQGFSKIWRSDLVFDLTWPSFDHDLDVMMIDILTKFHELWIKTVPSRVYTSWKVNRWTLEHLVRHGRPQGFSKIWRSDLVFDLTWPSFDHDLDVMMIDILTKFHELWIKTVPSRVYTSWKVNRWTLEHLVRHGRPHVRQTTDIEVSKKLTLCKLRWAKNRHGSICKSSYLVKKFWILGQIGLSKQWTPRSDCSLLLGTVWSGSSLFVIPNASFGNLTTS